MPYSPKNKKDSLREREKICEKKERKRKKKKEEKKGKEFRGKGENSSPRFLLTYLMVS